MATYTVEVTETEHRALEYVTADPTDWAVKTVKNRASKATDEICRILMFHCNENEIAIAVGKEAQVAQAYDLGIIKTGAQRNAELEELYSESTPSDADPMASENP